ncbi:MAG: S46 family peptidase [Myxococcales bacterium]|nr:S46 family peptidase [Myxococcales bacterium]
MAAPHRRLHDPPGLRRPRRHAAGPRPGQPPLPPGALAAARPGGGPAGRPGRGPRLPWRTTRYLWVAELTRTLDQTLPALIDLYGEWIAIAEELGAADPAVAIKVAATKKSLANRHKNSRGMIDGVKAMGLRERREAEEARLREGEGAALLADLAEYSADARARYPTAFALHRFAHAPSLVDAAVSLVRWARERQRPERERADGYLERDRDDLWNGIARRLRDHDVEVEAHLLAAVLARAAALPPTENARVDALAGLIAGKRGDRQVFLPATRRLLKGTRLADTEAMRGLFDAADPAALRASRDPLLVLANALVDAIERDEAEEEARRGRRMVLEPAYFELLRGVRPGPLYPDANGTLRFSVATVRGYRPRDGLEALPQTTLRGQLAKLTGAEPFTLPERVVAAAAGAAESYWADPGLADLVLCLLADGDTTGGNSGSAVVNGRGEVIGLNFDRVWENIAGDVAYSNERSRNIIVDVRYLLWLLDRVEDAGALLDELGVGDRRGEPRRPAPKDSKEATAPSPSMVTTIEGPRGDGQHEDGARGAGARASEAGCACASAPLRGLGPLLLGALALGLRRRR